MSQRLVAKGLAPNTAQPSSNNNNNNGESSNSNNANGGGGGAAAARGGERLVGEELYQVRRPQRAIVARGGADRCPGCGCRGCFCTSTAVALVVVYLRGWRRFPAMAMVAAYPR